MKQTLQIIGGALLCLGVLFMGLPDKTIRKLLPLTKKASHSESVTNGFAQLPDSNSVVASVTTNGIYWAASRDVKKWIEFYQIWKCEDGTFELRSEDFIKGKFSTLDEARAAKVKLAVEMAEFVRTNKFESWFPRPPYCGTKVE